ncbi:hypothetical protein [Phenylobacterium sp.]|uniref:hypothetical protein n=1 Tax=Phenylobacterium sp. TaxID=1871053 RepID=UPI003BAD8587
MLGRLRLPVTEVCDDRRHDRPPNGAHGLQAPGHDLASGQAGDTRNLAQFGG